MADTNKKSDFQIIAGALGGNKETLDKMQQVYSATAKQVGKYLKLGGSLITGGTMAIEIASALVQMFGSGKGPSEFDLLFDQIKGLIGKLEKKLDAMQRAETYQALADIRGSANAAISIARSWADEVSKGGDPLTSSYSGQFNAAAAENTKALYAIMEDAYWRRTYDSSLVCDVPGSVRERYAQPREGEGQLFVWDYRAALPVFLRVIEAYLLCAKLASSPMTAAAKQDLAIAATKLTEVHDRIKSGFVLIEAPAARAPGSIKGPDWQYSILVNGFWDPAGQTCGAVDIYGCYAVTEKFPLQQPLPKQLVTDVHVPGQFKNVPVEPSTKAEVVEVQQGEGRRHFNLLYLARALRARAQLDALAGLPQLRNLITLLRSAADLPTSPSDLPQPVPFGIAEIVAPPSYLRQQLERNLSLFQPPLMLPFQVEWPANTKAVVEEFTERYRPGKEPSMAAVVLGETT